MTNLPATSTQELPPTPPEDAFRFGRNWQNYTARHLDPDRERIAAESLSELVGDLTGKTFLDIGCGSGLFSLCAHRAGAARVVSLDVDPDSVAATRALHARAGAPDSWRVLRRSILDRSLLDELDPAGVVYAWGVLHHTGDMYTAIRNAAALVKPGGLFVIAIYNRVTGGFLSSGRWWQLKRVYNHATRPVQLGMEWGFRVAWVLQSLRRRQNPIRVVREYRHSRGMAVWTDLVDWLGGFPYEFASVEEIVGFCERSCGLRLARLSPVSERDTGNNQFVFRRPTG